MPRTRNYFLLLVIAGFGALVLIELQFNNQLPLFSASGNAPTFSTETTPKLSVGPEDMDDQLRQDRLVAMREKISNSQQLILTASVPEEDTTLEDSEIQTDEEVLLQCGNYQSYTGNWSAAGVTIEEVEGARIVYRSSAQVGGETTEGTLPSSNTEILAQLSIRSTPGTATCIPSDVIGIALDGSLIRNNEVGAYGVFGANTTIGYALDGFPIQGVSSESTDRCGGRIAGDQYRYFIDAERATIINCFSGTPVKL